MIHAPEAQIPINNLQKFINNVEATYAYDRPNEHVEAAFIKSSDVHSGHLEIVIEDKHTQTSTTRKYSIEEVRIFRELFNRPDVIQQLGQLKISSDD